MSSIRLDKKNPYEQLKGIFTILSLLTLGSALYANVIVQKDLNSNYAFMMLIPLAASLYTAFIAHFSKTLLIKKDVAIIKEVIIGALISYAYYQDVSSSLENTVYFLGFCNFALIFFYNFNTENLNHLESID